MAREGRKRKSSLYSVFFTFAVDNLGATIVFPIFSPLFLDPSKGLLPADLSLSYKTTLLGIFLGIYPLMQFIFSPILGEYADHFGRKRAFLLTTFLTFLGYILSAYGIHYHSLFWVFLARLLMGVGAGNLSICLSTISDLSPNRRKKMRYYSCGSAVAGLTFILGPFLGGKLSDPTVAPLFDSSFPMLIGAFLGLANIFFILFAFVETLDASSPAPFDPIKGIHNIQTVLRTRSIRPLYLIYFFFLFSWNSIFLFIPAFVVENFRLSNSSIGDICAFLGLCWIFGTGVLHRLVYRKIKTKWILFFSFFLFATLVIFVPQALSLKSFLIFLGSCTALAGFIWPICTGAISNAAPRSIQGKVLGLSQSMFSITMIFSSFLGGIFLHAHSMVPFVFSSVSALTAAFLLTRVQVE